MEFQLSGENFDKMGSEIVGVLATENGDPLHNRDSVNEAILVHEISRTKTTLLLAATMENHYSFPYYLGGILSADRETVYWENNTRPLP